MAVDFSGTLKAAQDVFADDEGIMINPIKSQPGEAPYLARGIWSDPAVSYEDRLSGSGAAVVGNHPEVDISLAEFIVPPVQGDGLTRNKTGKTYTILEPLRDGLGGAALPLGGA